MRKIILPIIVVIALAMVLLNINSIGKNIMNYVNGSKDVVILPGNEYRKDTDYLFVKRVNSYVPYSYNDLVNIYFNFINNGWNTFTFYCPSEYSECLNDVDKIRKDKTLLSNINNFVHPYNSFDRINTAVASSGEVTLSLTKLYTEEDIYQINKKVDEIMDELFMGEENLDDTEKILKVHDYIINNARYDIERNEKGTSQYKSNTAYGVLFQGYAVCSGYTDAMAIFLSKMGFNNYKIATDTHVWNAVYYKDENGKEKWVHLDLTWDDPVVKDNPSANYINHKYFLVNNSTLLKEDESKVDASQTFANHDFDKSIYLEFKED